MNKILFDFIKKDKPKTKIWSIKDYYNARNKILINTKYGGIGDILAHRLIFEDLRKIVPEIHWLVPKKYAELAEGHPFVSVASDDNYIFCYNASAFVSQYETSPTMGHKPKSRPDILAETFDITLNAPQMYLQVKQVYRSWAKQQLKGIANPKVFLAPHSTEITRDLTYKQILGVSKKLKEMGCFVYTTNHKNYDFQDAPISQFKDVSLGQWMGLIAEADYIISVDTGAFHLAAGLKKPLVGIFSYIDGNIRGKYYDFILVQKKIGSECPCWNYLNCPYTSRQIKPCQTELSIDEIMTGVYKMFNKWRGKWFRKDK